MRESAWRAERSITASLTPATPDPAGPPRRRLPPRPDWYSGDTVTTPAVHLATAGALGPRKVRARA